MAKLALALSLLAAAVTQILTDPRITGEFIGRSLLAIVVYVLHCAIGFTVLWYLLPSGPGAALGKTAAIVGWIGLGVLDLLRLAPRLREPPAWLMRFGIADAGLLLVIAAGALAAMWNG